MSRLCAGNMAHFWVSAATGPIDCQPGFDIAEQLLGQLSMPTTTPVQLVQQVRIRTLALNISTAALKTCSCWACICAEGRTDRLPQSCSKILSKLFCPSTLDNLACYVQGAEPDDFWQHLGKGQPSAARSQAAHGTDVSNGLTADASQDAMFADPKVHFPCVMASAVSKIKLSWLADFSSPSLAVLLATSNVVANLLCDLCDVIIISLPSKHRAWLTPAATSIETVVSLID